MTTHIHFGDLSDYSYQVAPFVFSGVKNVGWLNLLDKYPTGHVPDEILQKLKSVVQRSGPFRPIVEPIRELPVCQVCGELKMFDSTSQSFLLNAELWIPAGETIYASPITILHYIEEHKYLPPADYLKAVEALDPSTEFDGNKVYRQKLVESGWVYKPD